MKVTICLLLGLTLTACSSTKDSSNMQEASINSTPLKVGVVNFDFDSSNITPQEEEELNRIVDKLRQDPETKKLVIKGHAGLIGPDSYNQKLSFRRAYQVKEALIAKGIRPSTIAIDSFGEERPIIQTMDRERNSINRRAIVEIVTDQEKFSITSN